MSIFSWFKCYFATKSIDINPANGNPMVGAVDIEGNPYGMDIHDNSDILSQDTFSDSGFDPFEDTCSGLSIDPFDDMF